MSRDLPYYLGFSYCYGIGPLRFDALRSEFGALSSAYHASPRDLQRVLDEKRVKDFVAFRERFNPKAALRTLKEKQITVLTQEDPRYPKQLRQLTDAPICLYVKGDITLFNFEKETFFAIVGTRMPSSYGRQITALFARDLAAGMVIVSGLALGVDGIAHTAALEAGGKTIAFVGCGVDIIYPPKHKDLYHKIVSGTGCVISEFPPGHTVLPGLFVARNRLISGLSRGVLVAEGLKDSGSLITARYAAEQGKEVFAPPVPITSPLSEAPNILLKEGATFITSPQDVYEAFSIKHVACRAKRIVALEGMEKDIYTLLEQELLSPDEIALATKSSILIVLKLLTQMELQGLIQSDGAGRYEINESFGMS